MRGGYIKLDRKILDWEWYSDPNTMRVFIHLLLIAQWEDGRFLGVDIPRGSVASSYQKIADDTGLTARQVQVAIQHLVMSNTLSVTRHSKFSVFTVVSYNLYQDKCHSEGKSDVNQMSFRCHSDCQSDVNIKEYKEAKKKNNLKENSKEKFSPPSLDDVKEYAEARQSTVDPVKFFDYYEAGQWHDSNGKAVKNWKQKFLTWEKHQSGDTEQKEEEPKSIYAEFGGLVL